jgi:hypothetical protein
MLPPKIDGSRGRQLLPLVVLTVVVAAVQGCQREGAVNESRDEGIFYIQWSYRPDELHSKSLRLYASGFVHLETLLLRESLSLEPGWYKVDDRAALQALFNLAKEAVRSRPGPDDARPPTSAFLVTVRTTEGFYTFNDDILKLKDSPLPACRPFEFDKDGHSKEWSAMKSGTVIDHKVRR